MTTTKRKTDIEILDACIAEQDAAKQPTEVTNPKEDAYDTFIAPLMAEIIAVAKGHKINMFATFVLDDDGEGDGPLLCTTSQPEVDPEDRKGADMIESLRRLVRPLGAPLMAVTVTTFKQPCD